MVDVTVGGENLAVGIHDRNRALVIGLHDPGSNNSC